ncbi:hypothetical protein EJ03DRAFT_145430 [Teratosphaeria nubilosa]|uniref:Uncharacterized protein n=1 Tax=Teratosphaeria nubilosa TaxID=161662 RepID=A0A6G1L425_9PEZI|nr:hypothetical protein EJ03DRAFT_145430 [Teratosphaeria nubilosa]
MTVNDPGGRGVRRWRWMGTVRRTIILMRTMRPRLNLTTITMICVIIERATSTHGLSRRAGLQELCVHSIYWQENRHSGPFLMNLGSSKASLYSSEPGAARTSVFGLLSPRHSSSIIPGQTHTLPKVLSNRPTSAYHQCSSLQPTVPQAPPAVMLTSG